MCVAHRQWKGRIRMDGGVFHVLAFRKERPAFQRSEQQVDVAAGVLEAHSSRSSGAGSSVPVPMVGPRDNPVAVINQMLQRGVS